MSVPYPTINCLHPKKVMNPYTNETLFVPCGACQACRLNRAASLTTWANLESSCCKYTVFITLTFANRYIPRGKVCSSLERPFSYDLVDGDSGEILGELNVSEERLQAFLKKVYLFGDIPYLRKDYLQKFLKRLRYYVSKHSKDKIRYIACGEYGPVHFRPHYHLLLYFNDERILQVLEQSVLASWPFGRVDTQLASGESASYVAGYLNGYNTLPEIYQSRAIRPFIVHSQKLGWNVLQGERKEIYSLTPDEFIKRCVVLNGKSQQITLWRALYHAYYPKCKGFADKSASERIISYRIYDFARQTFPECKTTLELARQVATLVRGFGSKLDTFGNDWKLRDLCRYFDSPDVVNYSYESDEFERYTMRIYNELLLSRHFLLFVCDSISLQDVGKAIKKIDEFYKRLDYLHLRDWFENQSQFYENYYYGADDLVTDKFGNEFFPYFYDNVDWTQEQLSTLSAYKLYDAEKRKLYSDRIKHKQLNDLNKIFLDEDN